MADGRFYALHDPKLRSVIYRERAAELKPADLPETKSNTMEWDPVPSHVTVSPRLPLGRRRYCCTQHISTEILTARRSLVGFVHRTKNNWVGLNKCGAWCRQHSPRIPWQGCNMASPLSILWFSLRTLDQFPEVLVTLDL